MVKIELEIHDMNEHLYLKYKDRIDLILNLLGSGIVDNMDLGISIMLHSDMDLKRCLVLCLYLNNEDNIDYIPESCLNVLLCYGLYVSFSRFNYTYRDAITMILKTHEIAFEELKRVDVLRKGNLNDMIYDDYYFLYSVRKLIGYSSLLSRFYAVLSVKYAGYENIMNIPFGHLLPLCQQDWVDAKIIAYVILNTKNINTSSFPTREYDHITEAVLEQLVNVVDFTKLEHQLRITKLLGKRYNRDQLFSRFMYAKGWRTYLRNYSELLEKYFKDQDLMLKPYIVKSNTKRFISKGLTFSLIVNPYKDGITKYLSIYNTQNVIIRQGGSNKKPYVPQCYTKRIRQLQGQRR